MKYHNVRDVIKDRHSLFVQVVETSGIAVGSVRYDVIYVVVIYFF